MKSAAKGSRVLRSGLRLSKKRPPPNLIASPRHIGPLTSPAQRFANFGWRGVGGIFCTPIWPR